MTRTDQLGRTPAVAVLAITPLLRAVILRDSVAPGTPPRRNCDTCGTPVHPWRSPASTPRARCPACHRRLGAPPYAVEAAAAAAAVVLVVAHRPVLQTLALAWWAGCALPLGFIDAAVHRLPDRLTFLAAAGTIALLGLASVIEHDSHALLRAVVAGLGGPFVFAALTLLLGRRGPGLGDAKLMLSTLAILAWFGWPSLFGGLFLAFTAQGLWAVLLLARRRATRSTQLPLGPFLIGGGLAVVALLGL